MYSLNLLFMMLSQTIPEQPLKMIERYGIMMVVVVALAIGVIYLFKIIMKRYQGQDDKIGKLQEILVEMAKQQQKHPLDEKALTKRAEVSTKINNMLFNMLNDYSADRISIYEFHNGGKTLYGLEFNKASCMYEVGKNLENRTKDFQNVPVSTNVLWNTLILTKSPFYVKDSEDLKDIDHGIYFMLKVNNIKSYYANLLMDLSGNPIGIIAIEYINTVKNLTESELSLFKNKSYTISGMMIKEN